MTSKILKTMQNYKTDQSTKNCFYLMSKRSKQLKTTNAIKLRSICIDLTSKQSKMLRYVAKHSKQRKTTKLIKLQWIAYIWCQNDKNNSKLQTGSNYDQFTSIWRQNDQKHWGTVAKHSKQRKTTKQIKLQWIASICHQNNQKCWDTSQNIQNNAKLRKWSNYSALHRFDVKTIRNV